MMLAQKRAGAILANKNFYGTRCCSDAGFGLVKIEWKMRFSCRKSSSVIPAHQPAMATIKAAAAIRVAIPAALTGATQIFVIVPAPTNARTSSQFFSDNRHQEIRNRRLEYRQSTSD